MDRLQEGLDITENMYAAALQSAWDDVRVLQQRQSALLNLLSDVNSLEEANTLSRIKELTDQVIELAEQHRLQLGKELVQMKKGGDAQNAYLKNSNR